MGIHVSCGAVIRARAETISTLRDELAEAKQVRDRYKDLFYHASERAKEAEAWRDRLREAIEWPEREAATCRYCGHFSSAQICSMCLGRMAGWLPLASYLLGQQQALTAAVEESSDGNESG